MSPKLRAKPTFECEGCLRKFTTERGLSYHEPHCKHGTVDIVIKGADRTIKGADRTKRRGLKDLKWTSQMHSIIVMCIAVIAPEGQPLSSLWMKDIIVASIDACFYFWSDVGTFISIAWNNMARCSCLLVLFFTAASIFFTVFGGFRFISIPKAFFVAVLRYAW